MGKNAEKKKKLIAAIGYVTKKDPTDTVHVHIDPEQTQQQYQAAIQAEKLELKKRFEKHQKGVALE